MRRAQGAWPFRDLKPEHTIICLPWLCQFRVVRVSWFKLSIHFTPSALISISEKLDFNMPKCAVYYILGILQPDLQQVLCPTDSLKEHAA